MINSENDLKIILKSFKNENTLDKIRIGNTFVDDFLFEDQQIVDIPINALRVIFNIISIISNEQFRPEDRPRQLSLFEEEFETENNTFVAMKIHNKKISPSGSTKLSSYWLKKLIVIPEYNYILYNLVYNIPNNKHILFAIWLTKIPDSGITLKLSTLNEKFGLRYKSSNDFCKLFLRPLQSNLNKFNSTSFNYKNQDGNVVILPYSTKTIIDGEIEVKTKESTQNTYRLNYFKRRFNLKKQEMTQLSYQYNTIPKTKELIENAYSEFIRRTRIKNEKATTYKGMEFLKQIQDIIIELYKQTKAGQMFPDAYPIII
mgnify:CR=1 FL=1